MYPLIVLPKHYIYLSISIINLLMFVIHIVFIFFFSSKIAILTQLQPDLLHSLYGVTISTIDLHDVKDDAYLFIDEMLSSLSHTTVSLLPSPLIESAKKVCFNNSVPVVAIEADSELTLWSLSPQFLDNAKAIFTKKPYFYRIDLTRFNKACMDFAFNDEFSFRYVSFHMEQRGLILTGFSKHDVHSAKKSILSFLYDNFQKKDKIVKECLNCTPPEHAYLIRLLKSDTDTHTKHLHVSATITIQDEQICIKGTNHQVQEASKSLLDSVPSHTSHVFEGRDLRFIPSLLKEHVLMSTDHIILSDKFQSSKKSQQLKVYLYTNDQDRLKELNETMNVRLLITLYIYYVHVCV